MKQARTGRCCAKLVRTIGSTEFRTILDHLAAFSSEAAGRKSVTEVEAPAAIGCPLVSAAMSAFACFTPVEICCEKATFPNTTRTIMQQPEKKEVCKELFFKNIIFLPVHSKYCSKIWPKMAAGMFSCCARRWPLRNTCTTAEESSLTE